MNTDQARDGCSWVVACRNASNNVAVNVHAKPIVNAGPDRIMIAGNTITIDGSVTGENPLYYWDPPDYLNDFRITTPAASPVSDIVYTLYAASPFGCSNQDAAAIKVVKGIFVPTAFTPNGDGKNDRWRIPFLDPLFGAVVNVYNRFGQVVYHTEAATVDWDGNFNGVPQAMGTYVYTITYKEGQKAVKGTFVLIR